jgi:hypothetical protein
MPSWPDSGKRILVVEDGAPTREAVALALEGQGHRAARAANGREALDSPDKTWGADSAEFPGRAFPGGQPNQAPTGG